MAFTRAWRNFKRMQDMVAGAAVMIYAAAALQAADTFPGTREELVQSVIVSPAGFLAFTLLFPLLIPALRRVLARYVWMSFRAGFGQTVASVVVGAGMLAAAGYFIYAEVAAMAEGQKVRANVFSAFAAGIGALAAQAALTRALERVPQVRRLIVEDR